MHATSRKGLYSRVNHRDKTCQKSAEIEELHRAFTKSSVQCKEFHSFSLSVVGFLQVNSLLVKWRQFWFDRLLLQRPPCNVFGVCIVHQLLLIVKTICCVVSAGNFKAGLNKRCSMCTFKGFSWAKNKWLSTVKK